MRFAAFLSTLLLMACASEPSHTPSSSHHAFDDAEKWAAVFDDPARDAWQKPADIIRALAITPGAKIADIGAGTGYFAARIAQQYPNARVFAADVEPAMVRYLAERAARENLPNLVPVQAQYDAPGLPSRVDVVLVVDTYHHIEDRARYFASLKQLLEPGARVAIVDFRPDSPFGPPKHMRMSAEAVVGEMVNAGFALAIRHEFLPRQYLLVFEPKS